MEHDQFFKTLLRAFLAEFLDLFFPDIKTRLHLDTVKWWDKEQWLNLDLGESQEADLMAEVEALGDEPELLYIHIEIERQHRQAFRQRMWRYYAWIRLHLQRRVIPIAIYLTSGSGGLVREIYEEGVFGRKYLEFTFDCVGLPDLQGETYINRTNPLAYALAALMQPPQGINRIAWKLSCLRGILQHEPSQTRRSVLAMCVNKYLPLAEVEQRRLEMMLSTDPRIEKELEDIVAAWKQEERERMIREAKAEGRAAGRVEGLEKGRAAGITEGEKRGLLYLVSMRFGDQPIPDELHDTIMNIASEEELLKWYRFAYEAESLTDLLPGKRGNGHGA
ncbi:MAG: hypothetical protein WAW03_05155 [Anaerolineae bacterium]